MNKSHIGYTISDERAVINDKRAVIAWMSGMIFFILELQVFVWMEETLPQATVSGVIVVLLFASLAIKLWHSILVGGRELFEFLGAMVAVAALFGLLFVMYPSLFTGDIGLKSFKATATTNAKCVPVVTSSISVHTSGYPPLEPCVVEGGLARKAPSFSKH